jgi:hypothetical protein
MFISQKWYDFINEVDNSAPVKKLRVFDMDDTLVHTIGRVKLTLPDGKFRILSPAEYAVYEPKDGEYYGDDAYAEFQSLINPKMIKYTTNIFKRIYNAGVSGEDRKLAILTARGPAVTPSIKQWLQDAVNVDPEQIEIITLGDSDPNKKKEWIEGQILNGYNDIEFVDDSQKNVDAVMQLKNEYPHIRLRSRRIVGVEE